MGPAAALRHLCGALCGAGAYVMLEKQDGAWE
jgi:hypothetical protein